MLAIDGTNVFALDGYGAPICTLKILKKPTGEGVSVAVKVMSLLLSLNRVNSDLGFTFSLGPATGVG